MDQLNFLYLAAISLPSENESQKVLKSFYMTKSKMLFGYDRHARDLKFNPTRTCTRCNSLWSDGGCTIAFKERPQGKCKNQRKCRQMVSKHYKYGMHSGRFTRMSKCMAKKMCRQVAFHCNFCDHKQIFHLRPKLRTLIAKKLSLSDQPSTASDSKQRKRKSKTRFAGLDRQVMQNLKTPSKTPVNAPEAKKKKKKNPPAAKVTKVDKAGSAKSRALSKNSMMQLALLLKNKDSSSSVNRLEMMFK